MRAHHELMKAVPSLEVFMSRNTENAPFNFTIAEGGQGMFLSFDGGSTDVGYMTETDQPEVYEQLEDIYETLYVRTTHAIESFNLDQMADGDHSGKVVPAEPDTSSFADGLTVEGTFEIYQEDESLKADPTNLEVRVNKEVIKLEKQSEPERTSATQFEQRISIENSRADYNLSGKVIWDVRDYEEIEIRFDVNDEA